MSHLGIIRGKKSWVNAKVSMSTVVLKLECTLGSWRRLVRTQTAGPPPELLIPHVRWAHGPVFLTSSQVMWMLLAFGPHFEYQGTKVKGPRSCCFRTERGCSMIME